MLPLINQLLTIISIIMAQTIELKELTQNKTFRLKPQGKRIRYTFNRVIINGQNACRHSWLIDEHEELTIISYISGSWQTLEDGRHGYHFVPIIPSSYCWEVLFR